MDVIAAARALFMDPEWVAFRRRRERWHRIRHREEPVQLPEAYRSMPFNQYLALDPAHDTRVALQEMQRASLRFAVRSRSTDPRRIAVAQRIENFLNRWWGEVTSQGENPYILVCGDQITTGLGFYKLELSDADPSPLRQTPFLLTRVDPLTCVVESDREGGLAVEWAYKPLSRLSEEVGGDRLGEGRSQPVRQSAELVEVSTKDQIYRMLRSRDVWEEQGVYDNIFGRIPIVPVPAVIDPSPDPDHRYLPLIYPSLEIAPTKSLFTTMRMLVAAQAAFPVYDVVSEVDGQTYIDPSTNRPMEIVIDPWNPIRYQLPPGTRLQPRVVTASQDLDRMQAVLDLDLRRFALPDVLSGASAGEREPAWALALRGERAETPIAMLLEHQAAALRQIALMILRAVVELDEEVSVWTTVTDRWGEKKRERVTITPRDVGDDVDIDVEKQYRSTATALAQIETMRRLVEDGFISRRRFAEEAIGIADPDMEQIRIDQEKIDAALRPFAFQQAVQIAMVEARNKLGLPPQPPEVQQALAQGVQEATAPSQVQPRRPASPVHTTAEPPSIPGPDLLGEQ